MRLARSIAVGGPKPTHRDLPGPLRSGLAAGADVREREEVVREGGEDRVTEVILRGVEAMEVLRAVGRPAGPDEQRDDRQVLQPQLLELRRGCVLLLGVERGLPLLK